MSLDRGNILRICDRCQSPAVDQVVFEMDDQRFDLCASCRQVVLEAITAKPQPAGNSDTEKPSGEKRKAGRPKREQS